MMDVSAWLGNRTWFLKWKEIVKYGAGLKGWLAHKNAQIEELNQRIEDRNAVIRDLRRRITRYEQAKYASNLSKSHGLSENEIWLLGLMLKSRDAEWVKNLVPEVRAMIESRRGGKDK